MVQWLVEPGREEHLWGPFHLASYLRKKTVFPYKWKASQVIDHFRATKWRQKEPKKRGRIRLIAQKVQWLRSRASGIKNSANPKEGVRKVVCEGEVKR